jgi:hypothetical protein
MPYFGMNPGIGQPSLRYIPVDTKLSAADTNTTDKLIVAQAPLMYARDGSGGYGTRVALCADGDTPELVAMQRQEHPDAPVSCADLPKGDGITGGFQLDLPYTGAVPTGKELSVKAAGTQVWKVVAAAQALLNTGVVGSNNAITWTAKRAGPGRQQRRYHHADQPRRHKPAGCDRGGQQCQRRAWPPTPALSLPPLPR